MKFYNPIGRKKLHHSKRRYKKKKILMIWLIVLFFFYLFVYRPITHTYVQGKVTKAAALKVKSAFLVNDITLVKNEMKNFKGEFTTLQKDARGMYWMRFIPLAGGYVSDFKNGMEAGNALIDATQKAIIAIEPHADLIGFKKGDVAFTDKPAEDRIQTAVLALDTILADTDSIALKVDEARGHIEKINVNRYPNSLMGKPIRPRIKQLVNSFNSVATLFVEAKPLIKKLPDIMGTDKEKTYIVLFQNDKELRATGGFMTAYAIFKIDKGKFKVQESKDIYSLDDFIASHPPATEEIAMFHKGVSRFYIRDSNLSPDIPTSVRLFESLYAKSSARQPYDGIIYVDTYVLVDTLKILGDTEVRGTRFSANNDTRCDCPQVIYKLLDEIDRPVQFIKTDRKGILGDLLYALMQKALGFSPSQYWGPLSQELIKDLDEKHIQIYFKDKSAQSSVEKIGYGGRIQPFDGDYLHINDVNFAGAKSNLYVTESVTSKTIINNNGEVNRELTIEYRNPYPSSNCNLEAGQLCINAVLRNWLRVYVPQGAQLTRFTGSLKKVNTYNELGKTVFEGFLQVKPMGRSVVTVTYTLPFKVKNERDYRLFIQKQGGTDANKYTIFVGNQKIEKNLIKDYHLVLN